jgi:hypothetical protein
MDCELIFMKHKDLSEKDQQRMVGGPWVDPSKIRGLIYKMLFWMTWLNLRP